MYIYNHEIQHLKSYSLCQSSRHSRLWRRTTLAPKCHTSLLFVIFWPELVLRFWWEVSCQSYWSFLVCDESFFSCCFQDFLFVFTVPQVYYDVCGCRCLCVHPRVSWPSWMGKVLHQIGKVFSIYFFQNSFYSFLSSSSDTLTVWILVYLVVAHMSLRLCSFFFIPFSLFFRFHTFYHSIFGRFSLQSRYGWGPLVTLFTSVIKLFSPRISIFF